MGQAALIENARDIRIPYTPHTGGQLEFHRNRHKRTRVLACGARFGKDRCTVNEMIPVLMQIAEMRLRDPGAWASLIPMVCCWVVAPDYPRVKQFWMELIQFLPREMVIDINQADHSIQLSITADKKMQILIQIKSAKDPTSLVSSGLDLLVLTEAALINNIAWDFYLQPRLMSPGRCGIVIANGTPKGRNWFHRFFKETQKSPTGWAMQAPSYANPMIDKSWFARLEASMPPLAFRQEILAEFVSETGGVFIGIQNCINNATMPTRSSQCVTGIDWGKIHDATVFSTFTTSGHQITMERLLEADYREQKKALDAYLGRLVTDHGFRAEDCIIAPERNSMGEVLCEELEEVYGDRVWPFWTGASKRNIVDALALDISKREVSLLDDSEQTNELEIFEYRYNGSRSMSFGAPTGEGSYDDCVMAAAIANWTRHQLSEDASSVRVRGAVG